MGGGPDSERPPRPPHPPPRSQGSVLVRSTLVFGSGSAAFSAESAAKELRGSVDPRGFIMELQLADIQSEGGA